MKIPLVDLEAQYRSLKQEIDQAVHRVIESGQYILGPEVAAYEEEMAKYLGAGYAVGVASGTDALQIALLACGIGPGDEVITTPFTFIATTEAIAKCGARPVFVDIDPRTYNIDAAAIGPRITGRTRSILPVHLYGHPADMAPILELARRHNLRVIEDNAQSLGAEYKGVKVGTMGDVGCLSFFPSKLLGAFGDAGMVITNDPEIAEKAKILRNHGTKQKYYNVIPGFNSRLDSLQAAVLRVKLRRIDRWIELRRRAARLYSERLSELDGINAPYEAEYARHVYNYYTVGLPGKRKELQQSLAAQGISTAIYYPLSLHLQEVYRHLGYGEGDFPVSETAQQRLLSLPIYPELGEEQIEIITKAVHDFYTAARVR
jgi:dTDP-4-amino-4,6-dideoxygalactose transaminase